MKGLAEFMTTEKVNLGLDDYNDEDFEDGFEETQPQTLSQVDLPKFRVEGFWGERLDKVLAAHLPDVSRARLAKLIENGSVKLNGAVTTKIRAKATEGDEIELLEPPKLDEALAFEPQSFVEFEVIYEDPSIIVVNKPAGLVVHPGAGNPDGTLLNGLLYHFPELKDVPRGRDPKSRIRFKGFPGSTGVRAKPARTRARAVGWSSVDGIPASWVACRLDTGRTHQIRVHLTGEDLPLIGDQLYRGRAPGIAVKVENFLEFHRQALHASRLGLIHPATGEEMEWFVEPPEDMIDLMEQLGFGPWDRPVTVFGPRVLRST